MAKIYSAFNAVPPTTASIVPVATGAAIKTLLQIGIPATTDLVLLEWGISFDGVTPTAVPGIIELMSSGTVAATSGTSVTPTLYGGQNKSGVASLCVGGTGATCHSPSSEGSIAAVKTYGAQHVTPMGSYVKQFPLGREPVVPASDFLRIRVKFAATVNALCYIVWEE